MSDDETVLSPARSTRASPANHSPREDRAAARQAENELQALLLKPWRGQSEKLKPTQKRMLNEFEERGIRKKRLEGGVMLEVATTKYWVKWDGESTAKEMNRLNITRLFEELLKSKKCPEEVKESLAREMHSACAKTYLEKLDQDRRRLGEASSSAAALEETRVKAVKTQNEAKGREEERRGLITSFISRDPPLSDAQLNLSLYYLAVCVLMCHLPFAFVHNVYFRTFLQALRPSFEKRLGGENIRLKMGGEMLDDVYEEAVSVATGELKDHTGLITLGIDGHKDGRNRTLETVTRAKLGVSVFAGCEYMRTTRATGPNLAAVVRKYIESAHQYVAVVADNTSTNWTMFDELQRVASLQHLFYLGCYVHVLDLLIEDIAKVPALKQLTENAHSVISFVKSHPILYEEFLGAKEQLGIRSDLHLYPLTRFAYLYMMLSSLFKTLGAVRVVCDSPVFKMCKDEARRRGGEDGRAAFSKYVNFQRLVEEAPFKRALTCGSAALLPLSTALHYLEGDSVPLSHVFPVFQALYEYAQDLKEHRSVLEDLLSAEMCESIVKLVEERWIGTARKRGLKADVHLLAFILDPYAQAATTSPSKPSCPMINSSVLDSGRKALRYHLKEADQRALASQQLQLWLAARPALSTVDGQEVVTMQARNAFSSLYFAASQLVWDKAEGREQKIKEGKSKRPVSEASGLGYNVAETIARLKLADKPTTFWLSMKLELPVGGSANQLEAHKFFCLFCTTISAIVGHTCGVERAGKAYKMVLTAHRKKMKPVTLQKSVFILNNYSLLHKGVDLGDELTDFAGSVLVEEGVAVELQEKRLHALRRGRLITDEELAVSDGAEDGSDDDDGNDGGATTNAQQEEVKWHLPDGLKVATKPSQLDDNLCGKLIFMRWDAPYGWLLGKVDQRFSRDRSPRLATKFNYRVRWFDGWENHFLMLDNYEEGSEAPYSSWVLLVKDTE